MALDFGTTVGNALRYLKGDNLISDIDAGFQALAEDVASKMLGYSQDTFAKKPPAGTTNRIFKDTDDGFLWHDTGSKWEPILGPGMGAPQAFVARALGTPLEPNKTRPTFVKVQAASLFTKAAALTIKVNGVEVDGFNYATESNSEWKAVSLGFWVPPEGTWEAIGSNIASIKSSYQTF